MEVDQSTVEILDRKVPDSILKNLATKLAGEWKMLARWLNISEADLHNIEANNSRRMEDTKYFMLRHWRERNGAGATYRVLATALDKAGRIDLREYVERQDFVRFKVDLADHLNVSTIQRLSILLGLKPEKIETIKTSKTPGLEMVNLLENRGVITPTDITDLLKILQALKLAGLAERIQSSFQAKTYQGKRYHGIYLEEKKRDLIKYLKIAHRKHYETAKPFPSIRKGTVNSIFVEGGIYYLAQEDDSMQKPDVLESLDSYNDILSSPKTKSKRKIIEADPGFGKSTLASQFVYDWCTNNPESPLKDVEILIFLQLRQLEGVKSIYTAIKHAIVPKDEDMDESCIKEILTVYKESVVMLFDSYDEYPDKNDATTDIFSIIAMKMFPDILVIILTRTLNLPPCLHPDTKRIRLTGFGVAERRNYVLKAVADDVQLADRIEKQLQRNPFLRDLCQVPLFSTMVAHIVHERSEIEIFSTVTRFFTYVILCLHNHMKNKKGANTDVPAFEAELVKLYRIAFEGLTRRNQQLSWQKTYLVSELGQEFYDNYINLGILAQEVVFDLSQYRYKEVARISFKILCEFYASHHLVWILSEGASSAASSINVKETLNSINPLDHQYVYRFACGLNKSAADIIIKHLQKTVEGRQFALLCMLEQEENSDQYLQSVKDLVSRTIIIHSYHAKLLQRSTIQVLEVASANQIPISCVYLWSYSPRVDESGLNLIFQSGLTLSILSSLQKLVISDIDRRLTNEELADILSYSSQCTSLKELSFILYNLPNNIPVGSIPSSLKSRNVKVWNSKTRDIYHLNLQTGRWQTSDDDDKQDEQTFDVTTNYKQTKEGKPTPDLNYSWLKGTLTVFLSKNDCHQLARHLALPKYQLDAIIKSNSSTKDLLDILEERGVIHTSNVNRLLEAISVLKINETALFMLEYYQRSRGDETSYGRFLAGLSTHLTLSLSRELCDYFKFTNEKKKAVITSQTPGISFLLTLEDMGVINPLDVGKLVTPLKQYQLVQAVAKVQEYQTLVDDKNESKKPIHTLEGKQALFIECLRKKTKSWYETMTPLPWKKSCKWMASELFIACGLVLTNSKAKMKTTNVDPKSKLQYTDILTHERLKSVTRIIIEGDPGSGKTMLSSQLAYDWSIGKNSDARMVVFLPLKSVYGMTIIEAIKQFYIPKDKPLTEDDIKAILDKASDEKKTCIVLDGLEEYNGRTKDGEPSEVERVMRKEKFPNCTVVLTSRSDFVHGLPQCPMLKLGRFGEEERDQYINNIIPKDPQRQQNVKRSIKTFALLNDLCSIPLLFVYIVHNIEHLGQIDKPRGQLDSVGPFMEAMVNNLLSLSRSEGSESEIMSTRLSEIAFNGLCKGYQQLMWPKSFLDENVSNVKDWIESGILVVEEGETAKEREHQKKLEAVEEGMVTQDEIISVDDERREGGSSSEAAMIGEGQDDILSSDEESPRDRESSTDNKPSETERPFTERKTSTDPQNLSLQVKFLHKVIQEWFAAKHFSSMLQRSKGQYLHRLFLNRHLPLINPADLHYVLRFTSYLCPENSYLIMEHLHSFYKSSKGVVPEYILNCIFLCFIECKSSVGKNKMENTVRQVCENIVTIRGEDSRLLQQSKVSMLTYASNSEICIGTLRLVDLVVEVTKETLTFNSNITLEFLPTLKVIEVSQWDMRLKEEDFEELIKFITNCKLLNNAFLNFPSPPPLLTDKKLLSSMKKNLTIEWIIGERVIHTLDKESGKWPMQFRSIPHQTTDQVLSKSLRVMLMINKKGGRLDIPDTGVSLEIPSGALEGEQFIQMIIIPPHLESESLTFASNSSLVVELLPSNLNLLKPAKLTIPHCLVLKKGCEWKAKIYRSHHKEGSKPQWEEQSSTPYKLGEKNCVIDIQRFSWEKFEVDGQIVEAKNIIMYAAVRCGTTDTIYLDFGYYLNLETFKEVSKRNNASLLHEQPTVFRKEGNSLNILLEKFEPMNWTYNKENNPQEILYADVAISPWHFCTFVLDKTEPKGTDACTCYCKAGQDPNIRNFIFQLKAPEPASVNQPSTSNRQEAARAGTSTAGIEAPDLVVTTATIQDLSHKFCDEWRIVGSKLGIGEPKLQTIDIDNRTAQEKVYQMLLTWKQSKGNEATYRLLGEALQSADRKDLQEYLYQQDLSDQQIKIKPRNEDRERSSSKYHLEQKDVEDREKKRVSRKRKRAKHKHHEVKRKSNSPHRKRAKHKHHKEKRKSTSPQTERAKYKHHKVKRKKVSSQR